MISSTRLNDYAKCNKAIVLLSDKENFRKDIAPFYKANRKDTRKPMLLQYAREYICVTSSSDIQEGSGG